MLKDTRKLSIAAAIGFGLSLIIRFISFIINILMNSYVGVNPSASIGLSVLIGFFDTVIVAGMIVTLVLNKKKYFFSIPTAAMTLSVFISLILFTVNVFRTVTIIELDYLLEYNPQVFVGWIISFINYIMLMSGYIMLAVLGVCHSVDNLRDKYLNYIWVIPGIFFGITALLSFLNLAISILVPIINGFGLQMSFHSILSLILSIIGITNTLLITLAVLAAGKWSVTGVEPAPSGEENSAQ